MPRQRSQWTTAGTPANSEMSEMISRRPRCSARTPKANHGCLCCRKARTRSEVLSGIGEP